MTVLFLVPYPLGLAPSQRFRFEQYLDYMVKNGFNIKLQSFLSHSDWNNLYQEGKTINKFFGLIKGFLRRAYILTTIGNYSFIFIHREVTPIGPPVFEWVIAKIFKKRIIYDFDDAIWLPNTSNENKVVAKMKWHQKVGSICRWSYKISCGNNFIASYAKKHATNIQLNPTTIDTLQLHNPDLYDKKKNAKIVIGWTGSHSTLKYLNLVVPVLEKLENKYPITTLVISNHQPIFELDSLKFIPWKKSSEIKDLMKIDIGIMPLFDQHWEQGKCGLKALQFMALRIPVLASQIGVNNEIINDGINGFLCNSERDWYAKLERLILDPELRIKTGAKGRENVIKNYSVTSNIDNFLSLFE